MKSMIFLSLAFLSFAGCTRFQKPAADVALSPDGEIRSLDAALEKIRRMRASGAWASNRVVVVSVAPGRYRVAQPCVFTPADSHIRIVAEKKGQAVFDGGVVLPPFEQSAQGLWRTAVPEGLDFEQLFVNGRRAQRARTPNAFYLYMAEPWDGDVHPQTGARGNFSRQIFVAEKKDVADLAKLSTQELSRVEVQFWQSWDMARARIAYFDAATATVVVKGGTNRPLFHWSATRPRYALENYRAALDAPGEWFLDVAARELLYMPRPGETLAGTRAVAPLATGFVRFAGDPLKDEIVRDVTFEGLAFEYSAWPLPPEGARNAQSAQNFREAGILGDGVERFTMKDCRLSHVGLHGVWLKRGCRHCRIEHCLIEDLGGGGVYVGDTLPWRTDKPERLAGFNIVFDNIIRGGGHILNGAIGVWIGHASDNEICHNDIGDFRYSGVSMGWTWGYAPTVTKRNRLMWNRIHHIGQGVLSDMGGVYTLGDSEGTVEIGNWIHDVNGYAGTGSPAWGLYTDEGSRGILHASNLVERCRDGAVHQHYGRENVFANNIFATFDRNGVWRSRVEKHLTIVVTNNVFWWTNPEAHILSGTESKTIEDFIFNGNVYWGVNGIATNAFGGRTREAWIAAGHDTRAVFADPGFKAPEKGDWRMAEDSPARALGFVPWDWTQAGVLKRDKAWREKAMDDSAIAPLKDAPPAPRYRRTSCRQSFEACAIGRSPSSLGPFTLTRGLKIVRDPADKKSTVLRFRDNENFTSSWHPHMYANVSADAGDVCISFRFRVEDLKGFPSFEVRDYKPADGSSFARGPVLRFSRGRLYTNRGELGEIQAGKWYAVRMVLHLSGAQAGTWDCTLAPPEGASVEKKGLPFGKAFKEMDWIGFMSNGSVASEWHLDDISVAPAPAQ